MRREKREVKIGERLIRRSLPYEFPFGKVPGTTFKICIQFGVTNTCRPPLERKIFVLVDYFAYKNENAYQVPCECIKVA